MREYKDTKIYFGHIFFYYSPDHLALPICINIDRTGFSIYGGFWGLVWFWKKVDWED